MRIGKRNEEFWRRLFWGAVSLIGLVMVFLFQRVNVAGWLTVEDVRTSFFVNRTIRFFVNDALAILLIYALFYKRKYVIFSCYVQLAGMLLIMVPYFILKFYFPAYNGPLISYLHRLALNPTLLLLLIPAFYYKERMALQ